MDRKRQWKQLLEDREKERWRQQMQEQQYGGKNMPAWAHWLVMGGIVLLLLTALTLVLCG